MKHLFFAFALFFSLYLPAQDISREAVSNDLNRMVIAMETYHCNAFRYQSAASITRLKDSLIDALPASPSAMDAYRAANILACAFGDGHTRVWDYGVEKAYRQQGGTYFPFAIDVAAEQLIVREDFRETANPLTGKIILSINGVDVTTLIEDMSRHASRESAALDQVLLSGNFRRYLWLTYPWATSDFTLTLSDGTTHQVQGKTFEAITAQQPTEEQRPVIETRILEDKIAYLRIDHFEGRPKTFKKRFQEAFATINASGAERLILDLRGHGGGDSRVGDELARYLSPTPFRQFAYSQWKATPQFKENFKQLYLPGAVRWALPVLKGINPHTKAIFNTPDGELATVAYPMVKPYGPRKGFTGEVILLMDSNTFSAGTCFAAMFKDYRMGTIVGQESGNLANFHADGLLKMSLLNRQLSLQISNSYLVRPSGDETPKAVQPDVLLPRQTDALQYVLGEMQNPEVSVQKVLGKD